MKKYFHPIKGEGIDRRDFLKLTTGGLAAAGLLTCLPGIAFSARTKEYTFGSASSAGAWYPLAVAMSKIISDNVPGYHVTGVTTPGASRENLLRIDRKEMELGWSTADFLYKAHNGMDPFKSKYNVNGWFAAYPGIFTIVARASTGAKTMSDLKGLRIGTSTPGSMTQVNNDNVIFPAHGLIPGKDYQSEKIQFNDAVEKMIDGHLDACSYFMGAGVPGYTRMADSVKLNFIPIEESAKPKIKQKEPSFYFDDLPAGTYSGQKDPIEYVFLSYTTCCGAHVEDAFMYNATKAVFENLKFITSASSVFKDVILKKVYDGMPIPVHPGAAKYYKEMGVTG